MYCRKCPRCGAYLDPGEICDCQDDEDKRRALPSHGSAPIPTKED